MLIYSAGNGKSVRDTASLFCAVLGKRTNGKQGKRGSACCFCSPRGPKKACWGASPNLCRHNKPPPPSQPAKAAFSLALLRLLSPQSPLAMGCVGGPDGIVCSPRALTLGRIGPKRNSGEWGLTVPGSSDVKSVSSKTSEYSNIYLGQRVDFLNPIHDTPHFYFGFAVRCRCGAGMTRGGAGGSWRKRLRQKGACKTPEAARKKPAFSLDKPPGENSLFRNNFAGQFS